MRSGTLGAALARTSGDHAMVLMRGHGSATVGTDTRQAAFRAMCTEVNARLQLEAERLKPTTFFSPEEAVVAAQTGNGLVGRA